MIYTTSGNYFYFDDMDSALIRVEDIAHALSNICRFTGHTRDFYSVAEHSVHCSHLVAPSNALEALLHDAHEAFVGDMASPLKRLLPEYAEIEDQAEAVVRHHFRLPAKMTPEAKLADMMMLRHEKTHALNCVDEWPLLEGIPSTDKVQLKFWTPSEARQQFMDRYNELAH